MPPFFAIFDDTPYKLAAAEGGDKSCLRCFFEWRFLWSRCSSTTKLPSSAPVVILISSRTAGVFYVRDYSSSSLLEIDSRPFPLTTPAAV